MSEDITLWYIVEQEEPKVSDIHRIFDLVCERNCHFDRNSVVEPGLLFSEKQYIFFKNYLLSLFVHDKNVDLINFMGFKIKVIPSFGEEKWT
jgi:hypothetical protein